MDFFWKEAERKEIGDRRDRSELRGPKMAVVETFAALLNERGIPADASQLPDEATLGAALDRVDAWFWELTPAVREGYDEATGEEALSYMLAEADFSIAVDIPGLLAAFDQSSGGLKLSDCVAISRECLAQAAQGVV